MTSKGNKKQLNNLVISKFQKLLHSTKRFLDGSETTYDFCPEIAPEYRRLEDERVRRVATIDVIASATVATIDNNDDTVGVESVTFKENFNRIPSQKKSINSKSDTL